MLFFGEHEHTIDAKNRLAVPAEVREIVDQKQLGPALFAAPGQNGCLWIWPEKIFATITGPLGGSILPDPSLARFERALFSQSARLTLDSVGRVRLPDRLLKRFGLGGSVVILGVGQHLELVDAAAWNEQSEAEAALAPEVWEQARLRMEQQSRSE